MIIVDYEKTVGHLMWDTALQLV